MGSWFLALCQKKLRPCPHYARKILKFSLISMVRPTVHTKPSRKRSFPKRSSNRSNLKTPALRFSVDGKHFENGAFRKRWRHDNHVISLPEFSSNANPKWPVIVAFSNFSGVVWTENIWCVFWKRRFQIYPALCGRRLTIVCIQLKRHWISLFTCYRTACLAFYYIKNYIS